MKDDQQGLDMIGVCGHRWPKAKSNTCPVCGHDPAPIPSDIERCALLADMYRNDTRSGWVEYNRGWESACVAIAAAIRALRH